jgi:hypothetical protein
MKKSERFALNQWLSCWSGVFPSPLQRSPRNERRPAGQVKKKLAQSAGTVYSSGTSIPADNLERIKTWNSQQ